MPRRVERGTPELCYMVIEHHTASTQINGTGQSVHSSTTNFRKLCVRALAITA